MTEKTRSRSASKSRSPSATRAVRNELRIIGGEWRGRRFSFPAVAAIRPSPNRVRETLFNWLQNDLAGSRCLDLFAGSGALGLEALSRGAAQVVFVDRERAAAEQIRATLAVLQSVRGVVRWQDARLFLAGASQPFDVVFLDPPFQDETLPALCRELEERGWLAPAARIYIESPARAGPPTLPEGWTLLRSKRAGEVGYHLALREGAPGAVT